MKLIVTENNMPTLLRAGLLAGPECQLGPEIRFEPVVRLWPGCEFYAGEIGAFTYIGPRSVLHALRLGRYCSIGDRVQVLSDHPNGWLSTHPFTYSALFPSPHARDGYPEFKSIKPTSLGHDVWVGSNALLMTGVSVGDGAVVAAGAVVTKDVPPYAVVAGVPARVIKQRFPAKLAERMRRVAWWRFDLTAFAADFADPERTLDRIEAAEADGSLAPYAPGWRRLYDNAGEITLDAAQ